MNLFASQSTEMPTSVLPGPQMIPEGSPLEHGPVRGRPPLGDERGCGVSVRRAVSDTAMFTKWLW